MMIHKTPRLITAAFLCVLSAGTANATLVTSTNYTGGIDNDFVGSLTDAASWDNGGPTNANPGLVTQTVNTWLGDVWTDRAIRMTGGSAYAAAGTGSGLSMRGGALGSGAKSILEIEDLSNTDHSIENLTVPGTLTMWAQNGEGQELSLLAGYGTVGLLNAISSADLSTVNIRDGRLDIATINNVKATFNLLAGGTGSVILDNQATTTPGLNAMRLNFETGSSASFTINSNTDKPGGSAGGYWGFFVTNGGGTIPGGAYIDGVLTNDPADFNITVSGLTTTIALAVAPPPTAPVVAISLSGVDDVDVAFESVDGLNYLLEFSDDDMASWTSTGVSATGDGNLLILTHPGGQPATGEKIFYRVVAN